MTLLSIYLVFWLIQAPSGEEVVEYFPDGQVQRRFEVDEAGKRHGSFREYLPDGTLIRRCQYRRDQRHGQETEYYEDGTKHLARAWKADVLHGSFKSYHPSGKIHISARYRDGQLSGKYERTSEDKVSTIKAEYKEGRLDGKVQISRHRKVISKQVWRRGDMIQIGRLSTFDRTREAMRETIQGILEPSSAPTSDFPDKHQRALQRLKAYRYLCRVPWEELTLWDRANRLSEAAARLCQAIGRLSHTPDKPADWSQEDYRFAYEGTSHSNLSIGSGIVKSVDSYMDDSDPSNIDRVGHRRWCLHPGMTRTGFGESGRYSAMWNVDENMETSFRGVLCFPPSGYVPTEFFASDYAWSLSLFGERPKTLEDVRITLQPLGEFYLPQGSPLDISYRSLDEEMYGGAPCLVFRPENLDVSSGRAYRCQISFDGGKSLQFETLVEFFDL